MRPLLTPPLARTARALAALLLVAAAGCARQSAEPATPAASHVYPGTSWDSIVDPTNAGWSRAGLDSVRVRLSALPSTGFMAIVGGRVLMSHGNVDTISYLASVRKSILAMLYGNYVASGTVNLGRTLAEMEMDDVQGLTEAEKRATIRHLLTATSGVYHPASNAGDDLASAPPRGSQAPGTYMLYSNWDFNAAGYAFERETGRNIYDALESDLARPIGMQDFSRARHRKSGNANASRYLAYHMHLSTRDMARIGYLMLREGNWNGTQVIPRDWARLIRTAHTPVNRMNPPRRRAGPFGYGYLWWVWDGPHSTGPYDRAYSGLGAVGQHITVLPKLDLVVAHKTAPRGNASVSHNRFIDVLDALVRAHCGRLCR